jgi:hypothetical protein
MQNQIMRVGALLALALAAAAGVAAARSLADDDAPSASPAPCKEAQHAATFALKSAMPARFV